MPVTMRWQLIVDAIETRMKTILTTGGYYTNLGSKVFVHRGKKFSGNDLPGINIRDVSDEPVMEEGKGPANEETHTLTVEIDVACASSATTDEVIRKMATDIRKAISTDHTWGGLAQFTRPAAVRDLKVDEEEDVVGGATLSFEVQYTTTLFLES